jgi:hypothetical protein
MLKSITSLAGAAIILAIFATTSVQARQITADTPKAEQCKTQKLAKAPTRQAQTTQAPFLWLVLGVGF